MATKPWWRGFWPNVATDEGLKSAIAAGYWSSYIVAGLTAFAILLKIIAVESLLDVLIMAVMGLLIQFYKSRIAALVALCFFVAGKALMIGEGTINANSMIAIVLIFGLISGVRATFAFQAKRKKPAITATNVL